MSTEDCDKENAPVNSIQTPSTEPAPVEKPDATGDAVGSDNAPAPTVEQEPMSKKEAATQALRLERLQQLLKKATTYTTFVASQFEESIQVAAATNAAGKPDRPKQRRGRSSLAAVTAPVTPTHPYQPKLVTGATLRDYQQAGLQWLISLYENGLNGILADEMGLGKTLQCISLIAWLYERSVTGPFLIVAPLSTLANWAKEFKKFTPSIPVCVYHGSKDERDAMCDKLLKNRRTDKWPAIITSYDIIIRDTHFFNKVSWKYIMVDEGHRIKNMNCKLVRVLKSFESANRLLLTGTPLQNNLSELWSLLNFLLPDIFDDLEAFDNWFDFDHLNNDSSEMVAVETTKGVMDNLHMILRPFVLRRLKDDVCIDMPKKREYIIFATLTEQQRKLYDTILRQRDINKQAELERFVHDSTEINADGHKRSKRLRNSTSNGSNYTEPPDDVEEDDEFFQAMADNQVEQPASALVNSDSANKNEFKQVTFSNMIMHLRKCCNHPFLFDFPKDKTTGEPIVDASLVDSCGKMKIFDRLLTALLDRRHRVLVFSQMTSMLDILEEYLEYRQLKYCRIDGDMAQAAREQEIEEFNANDDRLVFLLSTRAGGLGINLTVADTVILYDSDWNPQMDLQAQDRCHRIGQTRPVIVYRLTTQNSVESKILEKAASKRRLEKVVIHKRKFKSASEKADKAIDLNDLRDILNSEKFNENSAAGWEEASLSEHDMELLLDRSEPAFEVAEQEGKFYRLVSGTAGQSDSTLLG